MSYLPLHCPGYRGDDRFPLPREGVRYSCPHAMRRKRAVLRFPVSGEAVGGPGTRPIGPKSVDFPRPGRNLSIPELATRPDSGVLRPIPLQDFGRFARIEQRHNPRLHVFGPVGRPRTTFGRGLPGQLLFECSGLGHRHASMVRGGSGQSRRSPGKVRHGARHPCATKPTLARRMLTRALDLDFNNCGRR